MDSPRGPSTLVDEANHIHISDATSCQTHHWPSSYRPSSMPLSGFWSLRAASESAAGIQPTWSELERLAGFDDASCPIAPLFLAASLPAEAQSRKIVGDSIWHMILAATSEPPPSPRYVDVGRCHMKSLFEAVSQREGTFKYSVHRRSAHVTCMNSIYGESSLGGHSKQSNQGFRDTMPMRSHTTWSYPRWLLPAEQGLVECKLGTISAQMDFKGMWVYEEIFSEAQ
ncbi:hypothetical protein LI328DRAFT_167477 [Trichoderma asperelloides]|nr:hypothetical protein LI328DRAFT_167477 [Trichoderma asperelloides]